MRSPISIRAIIAGSIGSQMLGDASAPLQFPTVNRKGKGNSLVARPREPLPPLPPLLPIAPVPQDAVDAALKNDAVISRIDPYADYEFGAPTDETEAAPVIEPPHADLPPKSLAGLAPSAAAKDPSRVFFGGDALASTEKGLTPWAPGEAPVVTASLGDPDIKQSALAPTGRMMPVQAKRSPAKGEVTGEGARPHSPAERLGLAGAAAPRPRSVSPTRFISRRAASRCADRSPSRKSC